MYEPLIAKCHVATKNANAAILLYRIAFWMPKAKVSHGALKWVANSASQWCQQTGLSFDQYRRAIALLRTLGLVETEQHLFGGKNITHVRLTEKGSAATGTPPPDQHTAASLANGNSAYLGQCKDAQPSIQGDSSLENQQGDSNIAFANAHAICSGEQKQKIAGKKNKNKSNPMPKKKPTDGIFEKALGSPQSNCVDAALSNHISGDILASNGPPSSSDTSSNGHHVSVQSDAQPANLANRWKTIITECYSDYVPAFTKKEFGQLNTFIKACPAG